MKEKIKLNSMKKISTTTVQAKAMLPERMIEDHINNMHLPEKSIHENILSEKFETINWCSGQSPVNGTIEISLTNTDNKIIKHVSVPVATNFLVICTKGKKQNYKITWSCSLS